MWVPAGMLKVYSYSLKVTYISYFPKAKFLWCFNLAGPLSLSLYDHHHHNAFLFPHAHSHRNTHTQTGLTMIGAVLKWYMYIGVKYKAIGSILDDDMWPSEWQTKSIYFCQIPLPFNNRISFFSCILGNCSASVVFCQNVRYIFMSKVLC